MFVLLFRYVFGGSITSGQLGGYVQFLMPGIFVGLTARDARVVQNVSFLVAATRALFGLTTKFGVTAGSYPSQHPMVMSLVYMVIVMANFVPLSVRTYNDSAKKK